MIWECHDVKIFLKHVMTTKVGLVKYTAWQSLSRRKIYVTSLQSSSCNPNIWGWRQKVCRDKTWMAWRKKMRHDVTNFHSYIYPYLICQIVLLFGQVFIIFCHLFHINTRCTYISFTIGTHIRDYNKCICLLKRRGTLGTIWNFFQKIYTNISSLTKK